MKRTRRNLNFYQIIQSKRVKYSVNSEALEKLKNRKQNYTPLEHAAKRVKSYVDLLKKVEKVPHQPIPSLNSVDYNDLLKTHSEMSEIIKSVALKKTLVEKLLHCKWVFQFMKDTVAAFDVNVWCNVLNFLPEKELFIIMDSKLLPAFENCSFEHVRLKFILENLTRAYSTNLKHFNYELMINSKRFSDSDFSKETMNKVKELKSIQLNLRDLKNTDDFHISRFIHAGLTYVDWWFDSTHFLIPDEIRGEKTKWQFDLFKNCKKLKVFKSNSLCLHEDTRPSALDELLPSFDASYFKFLEVFRSNDSKLINYKGHKRLKNVATHSIEHMVDVINNVPNIKVAFANSGILRPGEIDDLSKIYRHKKLSSIGVKKFAHQIDLKKFFLFIRLLLHGITKSLTLGPITMAMVSKTPKDGAKIAITVVGKYRDCRGFLGNIIKLAGTRISFLLTYLKKMERNKYSMATIETSGNTIGGGDKEYTLMYLDNPSLTCSNSGDDDNDNDNSEDPNFLISTVKYPINFTINLELETKNFKWCKHHKYIKIRHKLFIHGESFEKIIKDNKAK